jgi:hypothetical protein
VAADFDNENENENGTVVFTLSDEFGWERYGLDSKSH